ncbi:MAG: two component signal transduction response regulator [uncultured bacterium]|nr:MAG: two component signal transduction response regulator [uncultured bacterium]
MACRLMLSESARSAIEEMFVASKNLSRTGLVSRISARISVKLEEAERLENRRNVLDFLLGESPVMLELKDTIKRVAATSYNVLITGASGTGKELIARAIHCLSRRKHEPFVSLNSANLQEERFVSDLHGHEKGAFTGATAGRHGAFEYAGKGTVFLDEIGELSLPVQAGMLRDLQERTITRLGGHDVIPMGCRIVVATNKDLGEAIRDGSYRPDMYYRLTNGPCLYSPSLAERGDDIVPLALCLVIGQMKEECCDFAGSGDNRKAPSPRKDRVTIRQSFFNAMKSHNFAEGNIRELEGIVKRAMLNMKDNTLTGEDFFGSVMKWNSGKGRRQTAMKQELAEEIQRQLKARGGIQEAAKAHIATILACFGGNSFSPKAFIEQMKGTYPLHDNTARKYLRILKEWGILEHNEEMTNCSLYWLAKSLQGPGEIW